MQKCPRFVTSPSLRATYSWSGLLGSETHSMSHVGRPVTKGLFRSVSRLPHQNSIFHLPFRVPNASGK